MRSMTAPVFALSLLGLAPVSLARAQEPALPATGCTPPQASVIPQAPGNPATGVPVNPYYYAADDEDDTDTVVAFVPVPAAYASRLNPYYRSE